MFDLIYFVSMSYKSVSLKYLVLNSETLKISSAQQITTEFFKTFLTKMFSYNFLKGRGLMFGRNLVPFIMVSGNMANVMDMVPTVCYFQKQSSMQRSTVVDGKMEKSMYVFDFSAIHAHRNTCLYTLLIYFAPFSISLGVWDVLLQ